MAENENGELAVLGNRVGTLEKVVDKISVSIESIDESLKTLTRLDVKHDEASKALTRAFESIQANAKSIETAMERLRQLDVRFVRSTEFSEFLASRKVEVEDWEDRLRFIESQMPTVILVRNWVIAGVIGVMALVGLELFNVVVDRTEFHKQNQYYHEQQQQLLEGKENEKPDYGREAYH